MLRLVIFTTVLACAAAAPYVLHETYVPLAKSTLTTSRHLVDHGSTHVVHAPVYVHSMPIAHAPLYVHSTSLVASKTPDSAVTHHSSTVHETVPVVHSLYAHY